MATLSFASGLIVSVNDTTSEAPLGNAVISTSLPTVQIKADVGMAGTVFRTLIPRP